MNEEDVDSAKTFNKALAEQLPAERYVLRLFVAGMTARSCDAFKTIRDLCEKHLQGRYDLEVVDIYQHPQRATAEQIVAVPTLLRVSPQPARRLIGDLSDERRVMAALDITITP